MRFRLDIMVQILIKQGQVEVEPGDFIADYSDSLLLPRNVVEDLNGTIRVRHFTPASCTVHLDC